MSSPPGPLQGRGGQGGVRFWGAAFTSSRLTLLSSVLHWDFCVFTFELRTLKSTGLDDLCSFWL